jgi:hypothetical protein
MRESLVAFHGNDLPFHLTHLHITDRPEMHNRFKWEVCIQLSQRTVSPSPPPASSPLP